MNNLRKSSLRKAYLKAANQKKKGFTLIELIAVIAIIGILAAVFLPKVNGYIKEAKKVKVVDQCRKVVMAVESYNLASSAPMDNSKSVSSIEDESGISKYLKDIKLDKIPESTTITECYDIVNGATFDLADDGDVLNISSIVVANNTPSHS